MALTRISSRPVARIPYTSLTGSNDRRKLWITNVPFPDLFIEPGCVMWEHRVPYLLRALFAFTLLIIASLSGVATADDLLWARLAELTKEKGLPVNFKRASETFGLPSSSNEYPSYQIPYDESDGTAHHCTVYEDASKTVHLIISSFDKERDASRLGHAYLVSPKGELIAASEGLFLNKRLADRIGGRWLWAQIAISRATGSFEKEVSYWRNQVHQLQMEPDRAAGTGWEQKCEKGTCRWWNGQEKKWAE